MGATSRLEYRLTPESRERIEFAAEIKGVPLTVFARNAAEEKADDVLREYEQVTYVPNEFFDQLFNALDEPAAVNKNLALAARRMREHIVQR
ncbi:DUF1778 domain-containing protein [Arcanobacterium hippocoleae]|uniref:Uncharacterized protein (DUF1778 family) n=1 Tax=Arcanobacterium hippocoleae TaxID=149017 RepID=A0ABU1T2S7_9ACTO|nr:DUF1778 domain-containing protein [Arcanobacterium hippocoleae]MDR6939687.1 uncharacterized protein (DUF1778 family) [Arcanobacterium hippocoleae]